MTEPFTLPQTAAQPSQLYLNGSKLSLVTRWFDFDAPNYDPLPVRKFDGRWTLTDGHTRAFVAHLSGAEELRVVRDTDDIPVSKYERCVSWCRDEGITDISDLAGRVVTGATFETRWVDRCRSLDS
ncbi:histone acetyltransferase [Haladaptatus sp. CMAA 1911]|uniref:histone acetyltransferase n=1 Tax=unclassified Haladaptatus TaxID=2622732 RepID=UPI0037542DA4